MSDSLQLVLEDVDGTQLETSCTRFAVVWQGREVWIQQVGNGQLMIGVDVEDGDTEYANLRRARWRPTWSACSWKWSRSRPMTTSTSTAPTATTDRGPACSPSASCWS